ncbi:hypothetical protein BGZ95_007867 [Linnemannia exigua]|uniref:Uncharacterized protein n=1 Tax=Linnemannia exigua TaxID=604196 RepID=A0AAD4DEN1_9FUNG|nr:hypothetical protein BGZ95_007867 [Linnemannia exigua]
MLEPTIIRYALSKSQLPIGVEIFATRQIASVLLTFIKEENEPVWSRKNERNLDDDEQEKDAVEMMKFKDLKQIYDGATMRVRNLRMLTIGDAPLRPLP